MLRRTCSAVPPTQDVMTVLKVLGQTLLVAELRRPIAFHAGYGQGLSRQAAACVSSAPEKLVSNLAANSGDSLRFVDSQHGDLLAFASW